MSKLTCNELANMVLQYRKNKDGKYPKSGFISHDDFQSLGCDRDIHKFSNTRFQNDNCDFDFMGIPFFICNHNNTPLTLVGN